MTHGHRTAGFTLIELLIVIALVGILVAIAMPDSSPALHEQLLGTAQIVAGDLSYGRSLAVTNDSTYRFTFSATNNRFVLEHSGSDSTLNALPKLPFDTNSDSSTQRTVDLDDLPHVGPTVHLLAVGAYVSTSVQKIESFEFGPMGQVVSGCEVVVWLSAGTGAGQRYLPLTVNPVTGLVSVGSYSGTGPSSSLLSN